MRKIDPIKHEQKRSDILAAASRCFVRHGFRGASISGICSEANISAGHLYHYFTSKEAIIEAMVAVGLAHAEERFNYLMASNDPINALIREIEQADVDSCRTEQHHVKKQLYLDMQAEAGRNPAMAEIVNRHSAKIHAMFATLLKTAQQRGQIDQTLNPELAAVVLLTAIKSIETMNIGDADPQHAIKPLLDMLSTLIKRFLTPAVNHP
jgi:TetR/AcrR family transcriptional repressor of uid operon